MHCYKYDPDLGIDLCYLGQLNFCSDSKLLFHKNFLQVKKISGVILLNNWYIVSISAVTVLTRSKILIDCPVTATVFFL